MLFLDKSVEKVRENRLRTSSSQQTQNPQRGDAPERVHSDGGHIRLDYPQDFEFLEGLEHGTNRQNILRLPDNNHIDFFVKLLDWDLLHVS